MHSTPTEPAGCDDADRVETILVVEDEEEVRKVICLTLELQGYRVLAAASAEDALRIIQVYPNSIELLLVDVIMPSISGPQIVELIRRHRPEIRVMFMSGYSEEALLDHGFTVANPAFLAKPFSSASLGRKVRHLLKDC
ncbi:MAG: response regulator [Pirellulaceae bacterium]|nr:response regulator [Pirellulaceae bacterium]